jgi:pilus assembly protein CpaE
VARTALIVAGAGGPADVINGLLERFGFGLPVAAPTLAAALARLRTERVDLLVVPVQDLGGVELATLERELRKQRAMYVIGTAPTTDSQLILRAMRAGIHEFLVYPPDPKDMASAVDRLMRRTQGDSKSGMTIAVYSAKGGVGTTSVAVNVAFALAKNRRSDRVALVDMVAGNGDVRVMLNLTPAYDMGDLVKKIDQIDGDLLHSLLTPCPGGVWVLPSSDDPELADTLDAAATAGILDQLDSHFAFTVVDCEHHISERTLGVLDAADQILLVTQLSVPALRGAQRTLGLCRRLGYGDDKVRVVVNRDKSAEVMTLADAAKALGRAIFCALPNDFRTCAAALTKGQSVTDYDPSSALASSYAQLVARLASLVPAPIVPGRASGNGAHASRWKRLFSFGRTS